MKIKPLVIAVGALILSACAASSGSKAPALKTVDYVDLPRYMGRWYVIANIPYFLENGKVASFDTYGMNADGSMSNHFTFRKGSFDAPEQTWKGSAKVVNLQTNAQWAVQFIWPFTGDYLVIDLDQQSAGEYQWAVVGHPSRSLFWILSRSRSLDDATYQAILQRAAAQGYDISKIEKVPQPIQ